MKSDMGIKNFELKIEDADAKGIIRGFASTFGNIDLGDDVIDAGAFKKTLKESKGKIPILADHNPTTQIGWNLRAEESDKGLYVEGQLNMEDPLARARYALAKQALDIGAPMGLSIGYGVVKAMPDEERPRVRRLKEIKLYEYSIVTFPMNTQALITAAKAFDAITDKGEFIRAVLTKSKTFGLPLNALTEALLEEAAKGSIENDPQIMQSEDRVNAKLQNLLNLLQGKGE